MIIMLAVDAADTRNARLASQVVERLRESGVTATAINTLQDELLQEAVFCAARKHVGATLITLQTGQLKKRGVIRSGRFGADEIARHIADMLRQVQPFFWMHEPPGDPLLSRCSAVRLDLPKDFANELLVPALANALCILGKGV